MANAPVHKHTIGDIKAAAFISVAVVCDAFKILLFFLNGIPVIGTAIDVTLSFFIGIIEMLIDYGGLGMSGAFKGNSMTSNALLMGMGAVIDLVPEINDFPITSITVLFIIWNSRKSDKKQYAADVKAWGEAQKHANRNYEARLYAAQNAVANANAMRQQAMDVSRSTIQKQIPAANDYYPEAANYSPDEEFPEAA
jgi:hypothetical protein